MSERSEFGASRLMRVTQGTRRASRKWPTHSSFGYFCSVWQKYLAHQRSAGGSARAVWAEGPRSPVAEPSRVGRNAFDFYTVINRVRW
jgi:hypothetical protein